MTNGKRSQASEILQQLIRNRCVNDATDASGNEILNVEVLTQVLDTPSIETMVLAPQDLSHRASIVARIEGTNSSAPTVAFMGHTDVVPADDAEWLQDPFGGDEIDGEVWGRGAVDMLNQTAAMAVAMANLSRAKVRPAGTVIFIAAADEEAGGTHGTEWLISDHPTLVSADVVFTEIGGARGPGYLTVGTQEKGWATVDILVRGTSGHGSIPWGTDNAIVTASEVIHRLAGLKTRPQITPAWRAWVAGQPLSALQKTILMDTDRLDDVLAELPHDVAARTHACTRTTISPNVIAGGTQRNTIPDLVRIQLDIRLIEGDDIQTVKDLLTDALCDLGDAVQLEFGRSWPGTSSPTQGLAWQSMERVARRLTGEPIHLLPTPITGATDARSFRRIGVPAYGFGLLGPKMSESEYLTRFHGPNERIDLTSLELSTRLWEELARDLTTGIRRD